MSICKSATTHCLILKDLKIGGKLYLPMLHLKLPVNMLNLNFIIIQLCNIKRIGMMKKD